MPRKARIHAPGVVHHIMSRGMDGKDIFASDQDRERFCQYLGDVIHRSGYRCYAWALMQNHYHLVLRTTEVPLSRTMHKLNTSYAQYFNRTNGRRGYLFQERFKSIATQDQRYIEELVRYVHLNPFRAGICTSLSQLDRFVWCGHASLVGRQHRGFQHINDVLRRFGSKANRAEAVRKYREFIKDGMSETEDDSHLVAGVRDANAGKNSVHNYGCWVIGDPVFVKSVLDADSKRRTRIARYVRDGVDLDQVLNIVADKMGVPGPEMKRRSRGTLASNARKAFVFVAHRLLGLPLVKVASYLGISLPAASMCLRKGEETARKHGLHKVNY